MADIAIVYCSVHHGNTRKLLEGIAASCEIDLFDPAQAKKANLSRYSAVGFASGVYMSRFHHSLLEFLDGNPPLPPHVFILYTCGSGNRKYGDSLAVRLKERGLRVGGIYFCKGYDTFGPFRLVGGIAKGHPSRADIDGGVRFVKKILAWKDNG